MIPDQMIDLFVIGGGINGVGIAADAAGRSLSVVLCEKDDLANHTSSASSKLIHGGLRYLEHYEFNLVREGLAEREILLHNAPHLVHPLEFILPYDKHLRPAWMIRFGLFLYDHLAKRKSLKKSQKIVFNKAILLDTFKFGFSYMDCQTDDARLVVMNAMLAREKGATILTRTEVRSAKRQQNHWEIEIVDRKTHAQHTVKTRAIVNASGAWVSSILKNVTKTHSESQLKLVKGSHFTVPKFYEGNHAYILQLADKRIIFVIPYKNNYSLIGTTDIDFNDDPNHIKISTEEIDYLLSSLKKYFKNPPKRKDINWSYSGVRALYDNRADNPSKVTREYHLELDDHYGECPILSVFGGKITTYRTLAEHALKELSRFFPRMEKPWTANAYLPGGDLDTDNFDEFVLKLKAHYHQISPELLTRLSENYGNIALDILGSAQTEKDLGTCFGPQLYQKEVDYLIKREWAQTAEDILWRRTKLGMVFTKEQANFLSEYTYRE